MERREGEEGAVDDSVHVVGGGREDDFSGQQGRGGGFLFVEVDKDEEGGEVGALVVEEEGVGSILDVEEAASSPMTGIALPLNKEEKIGVGGIVLSSFTVDTPSS